MSACASSGETPAQRGASTQSETPTHATSLTTSTQGVRSTVLTDTNIGAESSAKDTAATSTTTRDATPNSDADHSQSSTTSVTPNSTRSEATGSETLTNPPDTFSPGSGTSPTSPSGNATTEATSSSDQRPTNWDEELLAFPGAQGFGRFATGGRGGDVYHVTSLADSGEGTLRDAISQPNRTVVFDVGGVIQIQDRLVFKSNQTIAGQTAPGGGITIYGNGTSFSGATHTIVRYVRFRMGKIGESGKDTVTVANGHDLIWDHCSLSWARDGNFDLNQESGEELYNLTLQDSIVAQGLQTHSTGGLVVTQGTSILRSLYIDNNSRNPKARGVLQFVNNVVYNWVDSAYILGDTSGRSDGYMVGNYFIAGPESSGGTLDSPTPEYHVFAQDNWYDENRDGALNGRLLARGDFGTATWETAPSAEFPRVNEMDAADALVYVTQNAGASLWRDAADDYVINELGSMGTRGATISDEVSLGLPGVVGDLEAGAAPADTDRDGMPDAWESAHGFNPTDANDRNGDENANGYTNLEEYLNSLVR